MGKLILCSGKIAINPFYFSLSNTSVYSIEELCFYIYENIYAIDEELFQEKLIDWLMNEVDMSQLANKLKDLIKGEYSLKDLVITILCSCDYYVEKDIKDIITVMDKIDILSGVTKLKIKADNYLLYKRYISAARIYEHVLKSKDGGTLSAKDYASVKHNLGIVYLHTISYKAAATMFLEAYLSSREEASLIQYLYALKLGNHSEEFEQAVLEYQVREDLVDKIKMTINEKIIQSKEANRYNEVEKMGSFLQEGKINEFKKGVNSIICGWKNDYRRENINE